MSRIHWIILILLCCGLLMPGASAHDLDLTVLYDNNPCNEKLETRWGFSCLMEGSEKTILFDVGGEGSVLLENMERLKIDPKEIDIIVLSHIHGDHIGGLLPCLEENSRVTVYMPISFGNRVQEEVKRAGARLVEVRGPREICKDVYSTGELGGWLKEQSLAVRTAKGLVVITGCAHPGIVNIVKKAKGMLNTDVYLDEMRREGVKKVAPCHCSGDLARKLFKGVYGENSILAGVGKRIKIKDAF